MKPRVASRNPDLRQIDVTFLYQEGEERFFDGKNMYGARVSRYRGQVMTVQDEFGIDGLLVFLPGVPPAAFDKDCYAPKEK